MVQEVSCGFIVYNDAIKKFLLLQYPKGRWGFAKGNAEKDESRTETALRELNEETGITDIKIVDGFEKRNEYFFRREGKIVHKTVIYFLGITKTSDVKISHEHLAFKWLPYDDAFSELAFKNDRDMLKTAKELLKL